METPTVHADDVSRAAPGLSGRLSRLIDSGRFFAVWSYATILILQSSRIWRIWSRRDLPGGDTCSYFVDAWRFCSQGLTDIVWSPLYTMFYGSLLRVAGPAPATILHRVLIVLAAAVLVLAVLRQLLPPPLAWLGAAWWCLLPVNFDPMYEVHLFALLPVLLSWWLLMARDSPWNRGAAVAILFLDAALVRNEMIAAAALLAVVSAAYELRRRAPRGRTILAYVVPGAIALAMVFWVYHRSRVTLAQVQGAWHAKHAVNMGQVYAFGYSQRHPEWRQSPWTDYGPLALRDFGDSQPTLLGMARRNPRALLAHVLWNVRLLPAGLQVMLFDATSGAADPGYARPPRHSRAALAASADVCAVLLAGGLRLWRRRALWWRAWLRRRALGWSAALCMLPVAALIVVTQRPRPEYLYPVTVMLLAAIGTCAMPLLRRWRRALPSPRLLAGGMLLIALAVPSAYHRRRARPIHTDIRRLAPYRDQIARPGVVLLSPCSFESARYVGLGLATDVAYSSLRTIAPGEPLTHFLDAHRVTAFLLDRRGVKDIETRSPGAVARFRRTCAQSGWSVAGPRAPERATWTLFIREKSG